MSPGSCLLLIGEFAAKLMYRLFALIALTELRYESFTPNHIRVPRDRENFSEPLQLGIHVAVFAVLQSLPQHLPTVLAFEVLLAIYIIWTTMQLTLRYKSSPALFGPLYLADSLSGFWYFFLPAGPPGILIHVTGPKLGTTPLHLHANP
jgi:hypothetical protein